MVSKILTLLIADDSPSDIHLLRMALEDLPVIHKVHTVPDGAAALDFLRGSGAYTDAPSIDIVVLDINMPKKTGHEVLRELKGDEHLRQIPVVMLSSSASPKDVRLAYDAHANCYVQKPTDLESWFTVVRKIEEFWSKMVVYPRHR
jgi:two-component system, chemotaxis family, response regulator Rcp1